MKTLAISCAASCTSWRRRVAGKSAGRGCSSSTSTLTRPSLDFVRLLLFQSARSRALRVSADCPAPQLHSDASRRSSASDPQRRAVPGHELRAAGQVGAVQCVRGRPAVAPRRPCWIGQVGGGTGECSPTRKGASVNTRHPLTTGSIWGPQCDKIKSLMPADSSRPESASKSPTPAAAGITLSSSTEVTFKESSDSEATPDAADSVV